MLCERRRKLSAYKIELFALLFDCHTNILTNRQVSKSDISRLFIPETL